ncbi:hypothetical protein D9M70_639700 [compost metagenome]
MAMLTDPRLMSPLPGCQGAAAASRVAEPVPIQRSRALRRKVACSPARRTNSPEPKSVIGWDSRHSNLSPSTFHSTFSRRVWKVMAMAGRLANKLRKRR